MSPRMRVRPRRSIAFEIARFGVTVSAGQGPRAGIDTERPVRTRCLRRFNEGLDGGGCGGGLPAARGRLDEIDETPYAGGVERLAKLRRLLCGDERFGVSTEAVADERLGQPHDRHTAALAATERVVQARRPSSRTCP